MLKLISIPHPARTYTDIQEPIADIITCVPVIYQRYKVDGVDALTVAFPTYWVDTTPEDGIDKALRRAVNHYVNRPKQDKTDPL